MNESKHTPGPWSDQCQNNTLGSVYGPSGDQVAQAVMVSAKDRDNGSPERKANARLIAAAPDLLAACEAALPLVAIAQCHEQQPHPNAVVSRLTDLRALMVAIDLAKGTTNPRIAEWLDKELAAAIAKAKGGE